MWQVPEYAKSPDDGVQADGEKSSRMVGSADELVREHG